MVHSIIGSMMDAVTTVTTEGSDRTYRVPIVADTVIVYSDWIIWIILMTPIYDPNVGKHFELFGQGYDRDRLDEFSPIWCAGHEPKFGQADSATTK